MTRILLATLGTTGDVRPFIILAKALRAAGADVLAASTATHHPAFAAAGATPLGLGLVDDDGWRRALVSTANIADPSARFRAIANATVTFQLPSLTRDLERHATEVDTVVVNGMLAFLAQPRTAFDPRRLVVAYNGLPPSGPGAYAPPPARHLLAAPGIFAPRGLPPNVAVSGAWSDDAAPAPLPPLLARFLDDHPAPVLVNFGSAGGMAPVVDPERWRDALHAANRAAVILAPHRQGEAELRGSTILVPGHVAHAALLPRVGTVVHAAAMGFATETLRHARPAISVAISAEQIAISRRMHELGVSVAYGTSEVSPETLERYLASAAALPLARLAEVAKTIAGEPGLNGAVTFVMGR